MDLISVIVPVYKVEPYLDRCVQSIVSQTYRNLEIILVDDGSPDNCGTMCDAWAAKDSRIRVIHKKNGGLSDARNAGLAIATGEYIAFVDSDDYISDNMYQSLYDSLMRDCSDIAACGIKIVFDDGSPSQMLTRDGNCVLNQDEAMEAVVTESWLKQTVWNKLYKATVIHDIAFPIGKCHEDVFWTWQAVAKAEKVSVIDTPCYFYVQRKGSIMAEHYSLRRLDAIEAKLQRLKFIEKNFKNLANTAQTDLLFSCMYHGQLALLNLGKTDQDAVFDTLYPIVKTLSACPPQVKLTHKCWMVLMKLDLKACCRIRNHFGIGL